MILRNGKINEAPDGNVTEFIFQHNESTFTVEHIISKIEGGAQYYFIEVTDKDQKKSTWKMNEMSIPKYFLQ
nr:hypothetical protein [uncultured Allomuricauda sp.]